MGSPFLSLPRRVVSAIARLDEAKNIAGKSPPPDSDLSSFLGQLARICLVGCGLIFK